MKYIGCILIGVAIGYYLGDHYEFVFEANEKGGDNG
jgi:hypothetical protein